MAPATRPTPYVTVRADPSSSSSASAFCAGIDRGGGGFGTTGVRQLAGGGAVRGGPVYSGVPPAAGVEPAGLDASFPGSGRCQYASSSGTPLGAVTFTDGTAGGSWRRGGAGIMSYPWTSSTIPSATPTA